ncbi:MAG: peptidase T, partial [Clostridiales bacterium]|nr:peptidase T [Clostridiales bacterium]
FGADFAYTMDGGECGELEYENFNAAEAVADFHGVSIHPGSAKGKMINALRLAMEFESLMPSAQRPECTEGREGFIHLDALQGSVDHARSEYIIRDHDMSLFREKKKHMEDMARTMNTKYGYEAVSLKIEDSYFNMKEKIEPHKFLIDNVLKVYEKLGIRPQIQPIRGGTDGAQLSFKGLPCPNLGTGDHNCHGHFEFVCVQAMEKSVEVIVELVKLWN